MSTLFTSIVAAILITLTGCEETPDMENNPVENLPDISGYPIVGTNQTTFFNNTTSISSTASGEDFHGQIANYPGNVPHYVDNGDGTVTDMVTGLMWQNSFDHNGDGTISDFATGLMWMQKDNEEGILWADALSSAENMEFAGYSDWRLPDAKELQSIVDYSRSPQTSQSPAIDPLFQCTQITNEAGETDYPWYWSSTTHARMSGNEGASAAYISFGRCMGNMPAPLPQVNLL